MKKLSRILLRICLALVFLAVVTAFVCLDGVDFRPYFRQPYYAETVARLKAGAETNQVVRGELEAGFGRAVLSPTLNAPQDDGVHGRFHDLPLAGYGSRHGLPAKGVHDDVCIKALALKAGSRLGVMVGADALIVPSEVAELATRRLHDELGLSREQVYLGATHTHCSLGGWGEGFVAESFAGKFHPSVRVWFAECIVSAVRSAVADLKPARFGCGRFDAPQFIRNRLVGGLGKVDPAFSYALVQQVEGKSCVLGVFGAHATILSGDMMEFSADYPGYWQRAVEQATGGQAMFIAGGVGSHSPVPGAGGLAGAEQMGQALARLVVERLPQTPLTNSVSFGLLGLDITMPPLNVRLSDGIRLRPWLASKLVTARNHSFIQVLRLDDSLWVSTPCDFSGELALGIKDSLRVRGSNVTITSFNGDYVGYVVLPRYYHMDGYEPRLMSFFGPYVPDYFDELIRTMAVAVASK